MSVQFTQWLDMLNNQIETNLLDDEIKTNLADDQIDAKYFSKFQNRRSMRDY